MTTELLTRYTNDKQIPLALAVYLATDSYDYDPGCVSATALIKPVRQTVLKERVPAERQLIDLDRLIQSSLGTSIHDGIEHAWHSNYKRAMAELGYTQQVIDMIRINPDPDNPEPGTIPVYMEQRHYREIVVNGRTYKISGKMDFIAEGVVQDYKSTIAYTFKKDTKIDDFKLQGSIYRWLAPHIITGDYIHIHYIFMDWAAFKVYSEKNYPPKRMHSVKIPLLSMAETEAFIKQRLAQVEQQRMLPEQEITFCTDKELWRELDTWKYYKNPANAGVKGKRSTKNFTLLDGGSKAAQALYEKDGSVGKILLIKGKVKACKFCAGYMACTQKDQYLQDGTLTFDE